MSLWPYFWLSYEGLESWQRFEAVLGFFPVFSVFVFLLEFNSHLPWHSMAKVKSSNRRGLMLVHLREGHMVTHGLPPKEQRQHFWLQGVYFYMRRESTHLAFVSLCLAYRSKEILGENKSLIKI